ncbi:hypothetical protein ABZW30_44710, partial [Kitasatospora sp. NPDC004669]|uniref:hypothetical protein n=1 Tax=Kitasatospora sp. NPDC004669 TaxID=3154555 RepID=UPI0033AF5460
GHTPPPAPHARSRRSQPQSVMIVCPPTVELGGVRRLQIGNAPTPQIIDLHVLGDERSCLQDERGNQ